MQRGAAFQLALLEGAARFQSLGVFLEDPSGTVVINDAQNLLIAVRRIGGSSLVVEPQVSVLSAEQLATIYRLRWEVEVLFRTLKMVGRLDHLRSANPNVVQAFIYATLLGMVLAHNLCAMMRRTHPRLEPSSYRVLALLLLKLPAIVAALGTRALPGILRTFLAALRREGINPNPGCPYRSNLYAFEIAAGAP